MIVTILFERCILAKTAKVTKINTRPTSKWKPLPLTTVELQKCGSRFLRLDSQRIMKVRIARYVGLRFGLIKLSRSQKTCI